MRLAVGNDVCGIGADRLAGHDSEPTSLFDASCCEQYSTTCWQGVPKAHLALSRVRTASLQEQPIGHHIIQNTEQDASVSDSVIPAVLG